MSPFDWLSYLQSNNYSITGPSPCEIITSYSIINRIYLCLKLCVFFAICINSEEVRNANWLSLTKSDMKLKTSIRRQLTEDSPKSSVI